MFSICNSRSAALSNTHRESNNRYVTANNEQQQQQRTQQQPNAVLNVRSLDVSEQQHHESHAPKEFIKPRFFTFSTHHVQRLHPSMVAPAAAVRTL